MIDFDFYLLPYPIVTWTRNIPATTLYIINESKEGENITLSFIEYEFHHVKKLFQILSKYC